MPPHRSADRPVQQPPDSCVLDSLLAQTRRLRGGIEAVRPDAADEAGQRADPELRWRSALCELAAHHLDDLSVQLGQLREGPTGTAGGVEAREHEGAPAEHGAHRPVAAPAAGPLVNRVGSAEWNLLTDEVTWSEELFTIFGRDPADGPLPLDEMPSWVLPGDRSALAAAVTDCLVDGRPIDTEFRITRPDGAVRTLHMMGEPVLDSDGGTASMWAVLRDVHQLRRSRHTVTETHEVLQRARHLARTEHRLAVELQEAVLPPWRGPLRFPRGGPAALDLAARYLPAESGTLIGGGWYDAMELPGGATLLTTGDLTGHGVAATSGTALLLGAVRGMAMTGPAPGVLLGHLNALLDAAAQPTLVSALCCCYDPRAETLSWARAGHPPPLLFRDGAGRVLPAPEGVLLGATSGAVYGQHSVSLRPGDLLVLHTDGLLRAAGPRPAPPPGADGTPAVPGAAPGTERLLALGPRFAAARTAQGCLRAVVEEFGGRPREDDACVLVARVQG